MKLTVHLANMYQDMQLSIHVQRAIRWVITTSKMMTTRSTFADTVCRVQAHYVRLHIFGSI